MDVVVDYSVVCRLKKLEQNEMETEDVNANNIPQRHEIDISNNPF